MLIPERWSWPKPPFPSRPTAMLGEGTPQSARVETATGLTFETLVVSMDPGIGTLHLQTGACRETMPFSRLRRLTLTTPLQPEAHRDASSSFTRSSAVTEREYRFKSTAAGQGPIVGRTLGYLQAREGFYLFSPVEGRPDVQRVFVPCQAYCDHQFGPFAEEIAGIREISNSDELLEALDRQKTMLVRPIGHSLLALGLLTQARLDRALAEQTDNLPLGEMLVRSKVISRSDLQRTLEHKMGYPVVDLARFPISPAAANALPLRLSVQMRAVPLMMAGDGIVVAVWKASRAEKLRGLPRLGNLKFVPVLASKNSILDALTRMSAHQAWDGVPLSLGFFATTT
ncbi:MAG: hypothetical protein ABIP94_13305 [Planctomycetota bacterium]